MSTRAGLTEEISQGVVAQLSPKFANLELSYATLDARAARIEALLGQLQAELTSFRAQVSLGDGGAGKVKQVAKAQAAKKTSNYPSHYSNRRNWFVVKWAEDAAYREAIIREKVNTKCTPAALKAALEAHPGDDLKSRKAQARSIYTELSKEGLDKIKLDLDAAKAAIDVDGIQQPLAADVAEPAPLAATPLAAAASPASDTDAALADMLADHDM